MAGRRQAFSSYSCVRRFGHPDPAVATVEDEAGLAVRARVAEDVAPAAGRDRAARPALRHRLTDFGQRARFAVAKAPVAEDVRVALDRSAIADREQTDQPAQARSVGVRPDPVPPPIDQAAADTDSVSREANGQAGYRFVPPAACLQPPTDLDPDLPRAAFVVRPDAVAPAAVLVVLADLSSHPESPPGSARHFVRGCCVPLDGQHDRPAADPVQSHFRPPC